MSAEKIVITYEELNTRQVEQRLRQQDAVQRNREYAKITELPEATASQASGRGNLLYNTIVYLSLFGLLGGFLAWTGSELLHFRPSTEREAMELMTRVTEINHAAQLGRLTKSERDAALTIIGMDGRDNPYFKINTSGLDDAERGKRLEAVRARDAWKAFIGNVLAFGVAGMIIAMCLGMAESVVSRNVPAMVINGSLGATLGVLGGVGVALFVEKLYRSLGGLEGTMTSAKQVFARALTWGVVGLTLTLAPGIVMRNFKKLAIGAAGGLLGGIIGGAMYELFSSDPHWGSLVGLCSIGLVAGAANGLLENVAKSGWLRVVQGVIAGKQFILYRNPTYIGSSPDNQIYLFKDAQVGRRHAAVHVLGGGFEIEDLPLGARTYVNGRPVQRARLRGGDRVQIGSTVFLFQEKRPSGT